MRAFEFSRSALSVGMATTLLTACGGSSTLPTTGNAATNASPPTNHHQTFDYTGAEQTFIVPAGVKRLTVVARGGEGGGYGYGPQTLDVPGLPGRLYAVIRVDPGDKLYVFVGASGPDRGFNGGGAGGSGQYGSSGYGGGGASDVRTGGDALKDRIVVAAGGGGAGGRFFDAFGNSGGNGGGLDGEPGQGGGGTFAGMGGGGATQSAGGAGGAGGSGSQSSGDGQAGSDGALRRGGDGGDGVPRTRYNQGAGGGGGGGGYYGGGGGGAGGAIYYNSKYETSVGGGGGGGSSYVERSAIKFQMWTGWRVQGKGDDGLVTFDWN
jgi:hypothetical protein